MKSQGRRQAADAVSGGPGEQLPKKPEDEARVVLEVTHGQTPRLRCKAEYPFKPAAPQPSRSPAFVAGDKVEGRSHGEHNRGNPPQMFNNPALLLWAAEADEEQARANGGLST